jgi:hypothetical protein
LAGVYFRKKNQPLQIDGWVDLIVRRRGYLEFEPVMVICRALRHFGVLMLAFFSQRVKVAITSFDEFSS